ncbi:ABC transporter ATP-binding protein [Herpetosiphon geysericola]|uniref:ABC-type quaternary amine transporter n=1 Tax=Herpetosiphon geysericola TaxID=70996 RepID=A0A0N8GSS8_9CHLR|nr:ABC transporter ATP-binding protein [Herpetosiphon geysericola]KPL90138.1 ABC transporter [Herpetosiphon geysericola]
MHEPTNFAINCRDVSKTFNTTKVLDQIDFQLPGGSLGALLGPSGCGKTTLLRLIAGFETIDQGQIWLGDREIASAKTHVPAEQRQIGMVFQEYALFPHLTVGQNVGYGLGRQARQQRIDELLELVGLAGLAKRMPHELSGGQQQRVALARALAPNPQLLLLDEPFSNLDAGLRDQVRSATKQILRHVGATALFVTHDQAEALSLADQVTVMLGGKVMQSASPHELYLRPTSQAVAQFVGEANFLAGIARDNSVECGLGQLLLTKPMHGPVTLMIRPEALQLVPDPIGNGLILGQRFYGHYQLLDVQIGALQLAVQTGPRLDLAPNLRVAVSVQGPVVAFEAS